MPCMTKKIDLVKPQPVKTWPKFRKMSNSLLLTLALLSSCSAHKVSVEIPHEWHTPLIAEMTLENPSCYNWWEGFGDCLLNDLITCRKTAPDIARSYIELRGFQWRLEVLENQLTAQDTSLTLNQGLTGVGLIGTIPQNVNVSALFTLLAQKSELQLAKDRSIFHLATLTGESIDCLFERLTPKSLFDLPCYIPVASPCGLARNCLVIEHVESALAGLRAEQEALSYLENIKDLKAENYQLAKDLNQQGLKSDAELQAAYLELLIAEDAYIQSKVKLLIEYVNLYEAQGL